MKKTQTEEDFDDNVSINMDALHESWADQALRMLHWCKKAAKYRDQMDTAKSLMVLVEAEEGAKARSDPAAAGISSAAAKPVEDYVVATPRYQEAQEAYLLAKKRLSLADGVVTALEHRKKALESLVFLHGQQYFAAPQARNEAAEEVSKHAVRKKGQR